MPASATQPLWLRRNPDGSLKHPNLSEECQGFGCFWPHKGQVNKRVGGHGVHNVLVDCPDCNGTGRQEITGPGAVGALLEALLHFDHETMVYTHIVDGVYLVRVYSETGYEDVEGDTLEAALRFALEQATGVI